MRASPASALRPDAPAPSEPVPSLAHDPAPFAPVPLGPVPLGPVPIGPVPIGPVPIGPVPLGPVPLGPVPLASLLCPRPSSASDAAPGARQDWTIRARQKIAVLACARAPRPPSVAVQRAIERLLPALHGAGIRPSSIVAAAEGGISLWFLDERGKASLGIDNADPDVAVVARWPGDDDPRRATIQAFALDDLERAIPEALLAGAASP